MPRVPLCSPSLLFLDGPGVHCWGSRRGMQRRVRVTDSTPFFVCVRFLEFSSAQFLLGFQSFIAISILKLGCVGVLNAYLY